MKRGARSLEGGCYSARILKTCVKSARFRDVVSRGPASPVDCHGSSGPFYSVCLRYCCNQILYKYAKRYKLQIIYKVKLLYR